MVITKTFLTDSQAEYVLSVFLVFVKKNYECNSVPLLLLRIHYAHLGIPKKRERCLPMSTSAEIFLRSLLGYAGKRASCQTLLKSKSKQGLAAFLRD